jgi:chorismate mutase
VAERRVRGLRGATTAAEDTPAAIGEATRELLTELLVRNGLAADDLVSAVFTLTDDLSSDFPARAARELGWVDVPLLCAREVPVPSPVRRCIRVLLHAETDRPRAAVEHVYLREARALRPDLLRGGA